MRDVAFVVYAMMLLLPVAGCMPAYYMFDDMSYSSVTELESNGWTVRTKTGWPGIQGAAWRRDNVSFHEDPYTENNRVLRMTSSAGAELSQTQICHERKYLEGTYAARVRFAGEAQKGFTDQLVQSFYAITPYEAPLDPAYSEMDFEYLPFGGWGLPPGTLATTTWETVRIEPWDARNTSDRITRNLKGWHTLVIQAWEGKVRYYMDGELLSTHFPPDYPDAYMSINFNLWFVPGGAANKGKSRSYTEEVDWVFFAHRTIVSVSEVERIVSGLKSSKTGYTDTVPDAEPPLDCQCDM